MAILFRRIQSFREDVGGGDCSNPSYIPLSDYYVVWKFNGSGLMSMGNMDIEAMRYSSKRDFIIDPDTSVCDRESFLRGKDDEGKAKLSDLYDSLVEVCCRSFEILISYSTFRYGNLCLSRDERDLLKDFTRLPQLCLPLPPPSQYLTSPIYRFSPFSIRMATATRRRLSCVR